MRRSLREGSDQTPMQAKAYLTFYAADKLNLGSTQMQKIAQALKNGKYGAAVLAGQSGGGAFDADTANAKVGLDELNDAILSSVSGEAEDAYLDKRSESWADGFRYIRALSSRFAEVRTLLHSLTTTTNTTTAGKTAVTVTGEMILEAAIVISDKQGLKSS